MTIFVLAGLAALIVSGCSSDVPGERQAAPDDAASEKVGEVAPVQPTEATPLAPIGRADLIAAFARAGDAAAAGRPLPDADRQLVGRTFSLKLPFGCSGEANKEHPAWAGWVLDRNRQALKLFAAPERWTDAAWVKSIAGNMAYEAVEGFWIERPWTRSEECPVADVGSDAGLAASDERQTMGIAQFFAPDSPRTFQRGSRAYAHTIRVREPAEVEGRTYRFAVSGRVTGFPDGQPIHCVQDSPDLRPVCLIAVELAQVSFEDPRDGTVLVEWRN
ncbi:hypothetical protein [Novosphingobium colocasiae]|uniref:hypothetical protein n=1 Tax=Novosphingobium colocasiae TaxID=1256513 RepID=UPI0035B123FD